MTRLAAVAPTTDAESAEPYVPQVADAVWYFQRDATQRRLDGPMVAFIAHVRENGNVDLAYLARDSQILAGARDCALASAPKHGCYMLPPNRGPR